MTVRILVTGGTFDGDYNDVGGRLYFKDSHAPEVLSPERCRIPVEIFTLMMIDSLERTDAHRRIIPENCLLAREDRILTTHGGKTLVLTGAMVPLTSSGTPTARSIRTVALAFVQSPPEGFTSP